MNSEYKVVALIDNTERNASKPALDMYLPQKLADDAGWKHREKIELILDDGEPWSATVGIRARNKPYFHRPVSRSEQNASLRNLFLDLGLKDKDQVLLLVETDHRLRFQRVLETSEKLRGGTGISPYPDRTRVRTQATKPMDTVGGLDEELKRAEEKNDDEGVFDPKNVEDARAVQMRAVVCRRGQADFRKKLLEAYNSRCAITDCDCVQALEAAHIVPYCGEATNHVSNGILLRADLHTLFDLGLIGVDSDGYRIVLSPLLLCGSYSELQGKSLNIPSLDSARPSKAALDIHIKSIVV